MKKWIAVLFFFTLGLMLITNSCENSATPYQIYRIGDKCQRCHQCVPKCGFGAISYTKDVYDNSTGALLEKGVVVIDKKKCVGCGECFKACPYGAIYGVNKYDGTSGATNRATGGEGNDD